MRVDQKPFTDKRVRQAVALCLNRPALVKGLLNGLGDVGNDHAFAPAFALSKVTKQVPQRKQDYVQAKKLLAAAGYARGLDITLTTENYLEIPQYAVVVKEQLKPAGINLTLNIEDQNTYYGAGANQPWLDVPMGMVDWAPRGTPSQVIDPAYLTGGVWNSAHWSNKTYDKLVNGSDTQLNAAKRTAMVLQAAKIQHDAVPAIIAYWLQDAHATSSRVHNVKGPVAPYPDYSAVYLA
jgi:peptide/nickel transport system substrate-binding protein